MDASPTASQEEAFALSRRSRDARLDGARSRASTPPAQSSFWPARDVYKVKRAVSFPFMDLSTLEKRREACEAEIAVNRANAPDVYLDAAPIVRTATGLALGGEGEAIEWACHMRRFDENATLDRIAERGGLPDALVDKLARAVRARPRAGASARRGARGGRTRDLYRAERRRLRARPDLFPPPTRAGCSGRRARLRRGAADAAPARTRRLRPARPRRPASEQHRAHRRRADPVRRARVLRRDRQRRRALRSRLPPDGPRGASFGAAANRLFNRYLAPNRRRRSPGLRRCRCS